MRELKVSTAANVLAFLTDSTDHVTGKTGLTLTITASKDGAAFASITPTVTELANGWYSLALTTTHTNTLGDLAIHITGTGADATDFISRIIAMDKTVANTPANMTQILGTAVSTPATAGILDVNVKNIVNVAATLDANNVLNVSAKYIGGTLQTARDLGASLAHTISHSGTAQSGTPQYLVLANTASAVSGYYKGMLLRTTGGAGAGQAFVIIRYDGATKQCEPDVDFLVTPDNTTTYEIVNEALVARDPQNYGGLISQAIIGSSGVVASPGNLLISNSGDGVVAFASAGVPKASLVGFNGSETGSNDELTGLLAIGSAYFTEGKVAAKFNAGTDVAGVFPAPVLALGPGGGSSGTGALAVTITVTDGTSPIQGAFVRMTQGVTGYTNTTDASGRATFSLDAATYTLTITKGSYSYAPASKVVDVSHTSFTAAMTAIVITPAADPSQTTAYLTTRDGNGAAKAGVVITFRLLQGPGTSAESYDGSEFEVTSDSNGLLATPLLRSSKYDAYRGTDTDRVPFKTGTNSTYALPEQIGFDG